jgi:hypothetical protein
LKEDTSIVYIRVSYEELGSYEEMKHQVHGKLLILGNHVGLVCEFGGERMGGILVKRKEQVEIIEDFGRGDFWRNSNCIGGDFWRVYINSSNLIYLVRIFSKLKYIYHNHSFIILYKSTLKQSLKVRVSLVSQRPEEFEINLDVRYNGYFLLFQLLCKMEGHFQFQ